MRFKDRHIRFCVFALLFFGLIARGMMPAGFMPGQGRDGLVRMVICTGQGPSTVLVDPSRYGFAHHQKDGDRQISGRGDPCAFANMGAQTMPGDPYLISALPVSTAPPATSIAPPFPPALPLKPWLSQGPPLT